MVRDINAEGNFSDNQINDVKLRDNHGSMIFINGQTIITPDKPPAKTLSDCERVPVSEKSLQSSAIREILIGIITLALPVAAQGAGEISALEGYSALIPVAMFIATFGLIPLGYGM